MTHQRRQHLLRVLVVVLALAAVHLRRAVLAALRGRALPIHRWATVESLRGQEALRGVAGGALRSSTRALRAGNVRKAVGRSHESGRAALHRPTALQIAEQVVRRRCWAAALEARATGVHALHHRVRRKHAHSGRRRHRRTLRPTMLVQQRQQIATGGAVSARGRTRHLLALRAVKVRSLLLVEALRRRMRWWAGLGKFTHRRTIIVVPRIRRRWR